MKITKVYLDLKEAKPEQRFWKDVRVLESEAFKDPLTLQLEYEPKDLQYLKDAEEQINQRIEKFQSMIGRLQEYIKTLETSGSLLQEQLILTKQENDKLKEEIKKKDEQWNKVWLKVTRLSDDIEELEGQIHDNKDSIKKIEQKLTKEPKVFNDTAFVSWHGLSYIGMYDIPDWEYILVTNVKIVEKNEYVANEDEFKIERIHVNEGYAMPYELRGTDAISTPTASIAFILAFIPVY